MISRSTSVASKCALVFQQVELLGAGLRVDLVDLLAFFRKTPFMRTSDGP